MEERGGLFAAHFDIKVFNQTCRTESFYQRIHEAVTSYRYFIAPHFLSLISFLSISPPGPGHLRQRSAHESYTSTGFSVTRGGGLQ